MMDLILDSKRGGGWKTSIEFGGRGKENDVWSVHDHFVRVTHVWSSCTIKKLCITYARPYDNTHNKPCYSKGEHVLN